MKWLCLIISIILGSFIFAGYGAEDKKQKFWYYGIAVIILIVDFFVFNFYIKL